MHQWPWYHPGNAGPNGSELWYNLHPSSAIPYRPQVTRSPRGEHSDKMGCWNHCDHSTECSSAVPLPQTAYGTIRLCIEFSRLNAARIPDTYPLPRMEYYIDTLKKQGCSQILTACGYIFNYIWWRKRDKTTFTSPMGTYRYSRIPSGLRNAPETLQMALDIILTGVR